MYVAALVLGNMELPHRAATRSFAEGVASLAQIGLFVMLGLLLSPSRITLDVVLLAIGAGLILTLVARPLSVVISSVVQPMPWRELSFISWAGLRGAVPIVLATIPLAEAVDDATKLFDVVFVLVVIYTLLTGPTLPGVARILKVARRSEPRGLEMEAAPLERVAADMLQITISPVSQMHGVEVGELRLPRGASVSMVIRDGETMVPGASYRPQARRRPARRDAAQAARADRGAAAAGERARPARPVARRVRYGRQLRRSAGCRSSLSVSATTAFSPFTRASNPSPTTTATPTPGGSRRSTSTPSPSRLATSRTAGLSGSSVQIWTTSTLADDVAAVALGEALVGQQLHGPAGQALAVAGVVDADGDVLREDLLAGGDDLLDAEWRVDLAGQRVGRGRPAPDGGDGEQDDENGEGDRGPRALSHQASIVWTRACSTLRCCRAARRARCSPSSRYSSPSHSTTCANRSP